MALLKQPLVDETCVSPTIRWKLVSDDPNNAAGNDNTISCTKVTLLPQYVLAVCNVAKGICVGWAIVMITVLIVIIDS